MMRIRGCTTTCCQAGVNTHGVGEEAVTIIRCLFFFLEEAFDSTGADGLGGMSC